MTAAAAKDVVLALAEHIDRPPSKTAMRLYEAFDEAHYYHGANAFQDYHIFKNLATEFDLADERSVLEA